MSIDWPCCSHCSCLVRDGHAQPCGQVGCAASRAPVGAPGVALRR